MLFSNFGSPTFTHSYHSFINGTKHHNTLPDHLPPTSLLFQELSFQPALPSSAILARRCSDPARLHPLGPRLWVRSVWGSLRPSVSSMNSQRCNKPTSRAAGTWGPPGHRWLSGAVSVERKTRKRDDCGGGSERGAGFLGGRPQPSLVWRRKSGGGGRSFDLQRRSPRFVLKTCFNFNTAVSLYMFLLKRLVACGLWLIRRSIAAGFGGRAGIAPSQASLRM